MNNMNIVEYDEFRASIDEIKDVCNFIPDVTTDDGYDKSKRISLDVGKVLTALETKRKEKKSYFLEGGKQVDSQAKAIEEELKALQLPHKSAYKELDNLKKEREAERKAALEERVSYLRDLPELLADLSSDEILLAMNDIQQEECTDYYEFTDQALKARNASREKLGEMYAATLKAEKDAVDLARLQKEEADRKQAEHEENIRKEASAKAEAQKIAAQKAKHEAEELAEHERVKAEKAERARVESEKAAEKAAEKARIKAEKDAQIAAKAAAEKARQDEIDRQKEAEERERQEIAKREANKKHVGNIRGQAKEAFMSLGFSQADAKKIVLAINNDEIPHISIEY